MAELKTISVFCAAQQKETEHSFDIDANGELVLTCTLNIGTEEAPQACGRFIKYPKGTTADDLKSHLVAHKEANMGQVSAEALEAEKQAILDEMTSK